MLTTLKDTLVEGHCDGTSVNEQDRRERCLLHKEALPELDTAQGAGQCLVLGSDLGEYM